jgi:hypothetical protein
MARLTDDAVRARGVDGPDDRADVVRIFNAVEHDDERRPFRTGNEILDVQPVHAAQIGDHALMGAPAGKAIEFVGGGPPNPNALLLCQTNELRQPIIGAK